MSVDFETVISSKPFQFIIGSSRKAFTVHSALVAHHSAPLTVLMEGHMSEAKKGYAELDDVDEKTFIWFCEYVYSGNYTPAPKSHVFNSSAVANIDKDREPTTESEEYVGPRRKIDKKKRKIHAVAETKCVWCGQHRGHDSEYDIPNSLWNDFQNIFQHKPDHKSEIRWDTNECEDSTEVLLCHARIYVFAHKYSITKLCSLALSNLYEILVAVNAHGERIADIVKLAQYCYDNNNTRDCEPGQDIDDLRKLVVLYIACKFETIGKDGNFLTLMEEGGPFPRDLTGFLLGRFKSSSVESY